MTTRGYSGINYDRQVENTNTSTLHKMKETYWTTKQAVMQKLGKKEDEHVVASDHELDTKLEVFRAIQRSSMELLRVIERYQDRLCVVSQEENAMGRFLKTHSSHDKTRAGKMMAAVGKSQSFAAQQRLALRVPLVRLYQEVETFRYRAISDTLVTINRMEGARTEYRGALLWMKNVSEELDPDTYKQLEKFRKVQGQVRKTKARFDKLKLDVMQKVDLLAASRCNMFSHVLANYQSTLLHFWEKTSRTMSAVAESFKGYQHYEFNMLKELTEPSKQLSEDLERQEVPQKDTDGFDPENSADEVSTDSCQSSDEEENEDEWEQEYKEKRRNESPPCLKPVFDPTEVDRLLALDDEYRDDDDNKENTTDENIKNLQVNKNMSEENNIDITNKGSEFRPFIEFEEEEKSSDTLDLDFTGRLLDKKEDKITANKTGQKDLLSEELDQNDADKDDMTLLNEILNAPSTGEDEFTQEWQAVFGSNHLQASPSLVPAESDQSKGAAEFMPSSLLDISSQMSMIHVGQGKNLSKNLSKEDESVDMEDVFGDLQSGIKDLELLNTDMNRSKWQEENENLLWSDIMRESGGSTQLPGNSMQQGMIGGVAPTSGASSQQTTKSKPQQPPSKKSQKADMSSWFNLFADLDPLSDPDAVGQQDKNQNSAA